jgi:hypothetical protein
MLKKIFHAISTVLKDRESSLDLMEDWDARSERLARLRSRLIREREFIARTRQLNSGDEGQGGSSN